MSTIMGKVLQGIMRQQETRSRRSGSLMPTAAAPVPTVSMRLTNMIVREGSIKVSPLIAGGILRELKSGGRAPYWDFRRSP